MCLSPACLSPVPLTTVPLTTARLTTGAWPPPGWPPRVPPPRLPRPRSWRSARRPCRERARRPPHRQAPAVRPGPARRSAPGRAPRLRVPPRPGTGTRPGAGTRPGTAGRPGGPGRGGPTPRPSVLGTASTAELPAVTAALPDPAPQGLRRDSAPPEPRREPALQRLRRERRRSGPAAPKAARPQAGRPQAARAAAAVLAAAALIGARSRLALHHWADDTGRQKEITAISAAVLLVLGVVGYAVLLHAGSPRQVASPTPAVAAPGTTGPTASAPPAPSSAPPSHAPASHPPVPVAAVANNPPAPPPPPPVRLAAMINVDGPVGFSRLAQVQFTVADIGSRATAADVTAAVALPRGVFPLPGMPINGWSCSAASPGMVCVHAPLPAGANSSDVFTTLVGVMGACHMSVQLTVTSGAAQAFASAVIPCGSGGAQPG